MREELKRGIPIETLKEEKPDYPIIDRYLTKKEKLKLKDIKQ